MLFQIIKIKLTCQNKTKRIVRFASNRLSVHWWKRHWNWRKIECSQNDHQSTFEFWLWLPMWCNSQWSRMANSNFLVKLFSENSKSFQQSNDHLNRKFISHPCITFQLLSANSTLSYGAILFETLMQTVHVWTLRPQTPETRPPRRTSN